MIGPIVTLAVAVLTAWLLTPVIGRLAWRWNIVDRPDGECWDC
jgi:hypothetical protein